MKPVNCDACIFYEAHASGREQGTCHRRAPRARSEAEPADGTPQYWSEWPHVLAEDWCGEGVEGSSAHMASRRKRVAERAA